MTASSLSYRLAVSFVVAGMAMGIGMAISQDHSIMPAHAHLNLLGGVSLFLFGIYCERRPALDGSRLALIELGAMLLFAYMVFRPLPGSSAKAAVRLTPAE